MKKFRKFVSRYLADILSIMHYFLTKSPSAGAPPPRPIPITSGGWGTSPQAPLNFVAQKCVKFLQLQTFGLRT